MLTDIGVDVAMALVFIVALGEMCKALSFQLTRLFNFRLMRRRYLMQTTVALCIESLAKVGAFTLLAFLFLPNWDDTSFSGSNQSPDQVCPGFLDYDICHAMAGCDSSDDAYCCSGTLSCARQLLPFSSRKSLFHNWLVGPFVVAPFVDMVPQVLAPLLASVLYRLADYSEGSTNFCAKCCCCACGWLARPIRSAKPIVTKLPGCAMSVWDRPSALATSGTRTMQTRRMMLLTTAMERWSRSCAGSMMPWTG